MKGFLPGLSVPSETVCLRDIGLALQPNVGPELLVEVLLQSSIIFRCRLGQTVNHSPATLSQGMPTLVFIECADQSPFGRGCKREISSPSLGIEPILFRRQTCSVVTVLTE